MLFQGAAILILVAGALFGFWQAFRAEVGPAFLLYLLASVLALALASLFAYRLQALRVAAYVLERDGIRLYWGLRIEVIPMDRVLWVRTDGQQPAPLPRLRWPGAVVGKRELGDGTPVEFMAARAAPLVLIAVPERVFAISPDREDEFLQSFRRLMELGSLSPVPASSLYPMFLLARFWRNGPARVLTLSGLALSLALLVWVSLVIPTRPDIPLRFTAAGSPQAYTPSVRLLLLPVLNSAFFVFNLLGGLFFFRRAENSGDSAGLAQPMANLLWGAAVLVPLLFLFAVFFILRA